jgi:hypothetical protein
VEEAFQSGVVRLGVYYTSDERFHCRGSDVGVRFREVHQDLIYLAITSARPKKVHQQDLVERLVRYAHVTIDTHLPKAHTKKYDHVTFAAQKNDRDHGSGRVSNVMLTSVIDAARNVHLDLNL